jgi:hypothetical protein
MRIAVALAVTLGAFAVSPVLAASAESAGPVPQHKHHRAVEHAPHRAAQPAPPAPAAPLAPALRPYPPGEGGTDGLSRDPEDCDKGCIGGNPG